MKSATHTLMADVIALQPLSADLRKSTVTFSWPTNKLIERGAYVVVPQHQLQAALDADSLASTHQIVVRPMEDGERRNCRQFSALGYTVSDGGTEIRVHHYRAPEPDESPNQKRLYPRWLGSMEVRDTQGRRWIRSFGEMVVNDFGVLVDKETGLPV